MSHILRGAFASIFFSKKITKPNYKLRKAAQNNKSCNWNVGKIDTCCQFHQRYSCKFFLWTLFRQLFSSYMYIVKVAETTFEQKIRAYNVGEIDTWTIIKVCGGHGCQVAWAGDFTGDVTGDGDSGEPVRQERAGVTVVYRWFSSCKGIFASCVMGTFFCVIQ